MAEEIVLAVAEIKQNPSMLQCFERIAEREGNSYAERLFREKGISYYNNQNVFYFQPIYEEEPGMYITLDSSIVPDENVLVARMFNLEFEQVGDRIHLGIPEDTDIFYDLEGQLHMKLKLTGVGTIRDELVRAALNRPH